MASIKQRHNKFEAKVRVPKELAHTMGGREFIYKTLLSANRRAALIEAQEWENGLRVEWAALQGHDTPALDGIRQDRRVYQHVRQQAAAGAFEVYAGTEDPILAGIDYELDKLADSVGERDLAPVEAARVAALQDAKREREGLPVRPRRELEPTFEELAADYVKWWAAKAGLKQSNTKQQKQATFALFASFWGARPLRDVAQADAAKFFDALRLLDPSWARSPAAKALPWNELQRQFGFRERGLSDATINRHATTLQSLWKWADQRGHAGPRDPFAGFRQPLRQGVNVKGYVAWELDELVALFDPAPRRADLTELMIVGLFTGMRLDEIASLRGNQLKEAEGVRFIQVVDAKTPAGNRQVPLHPTIGWLWYRAKAAGVERIWSTFNPEGPGKKAGADAGREFSRFKQSKGFNERQKAFHSFRKNVTRIMERARVPENEWAQVFGHEKGFTYGRYNADGITLGQKAEIIGKIAYPNLTLPVVVD